MADKAKTQKEKYLEILGEAYDNGSEKNGVYLGRDAIDSLYNDLYYVDPTKVPQWLKLNADKLSQIAEVASLPEFISITENPKTVEKDYGFTESDDFYKMDGPKSWMNKSNAYLLNNAKKYGLELGDYLSKVQELSTKKEQERQWKENANVAEFKSVPVIGDVSIPGVTRLMLPTSFNKAATGKEVGAGDVAFDIGTDLVEGAMATSPVKFVNPVTAALAGNAARQGKGLYDDTQDEFSVGELAGAGMVSSLGLPIVTKSAGDLVKKAAGAAGKTKNLRMLGNKIEAIGEASPMSIAEERAAELRDAIARTEAAKKADEMLAKRTQSQVQAAVRDEVIPQVPTNEEILAAKESAYGTGSDFWNNVRKGRILTDDELAQAKNFVSEFERGPSYLPLEREGQTSLMRRARDIQKLPNGDVLINAWAEPRVMRALRWSGNTGSSIAGGRVGSDITEADKKAMAKEIVNSTEWAKYVTGQPNNLTDYQIYIATVYGE